MATKHSSQVKADGGIQSLARAFALLEAIANSSKGIGLTQLSRNTGLHSSTVFHLLKTMTSLGYIRQMDGTKRYEIGSGLFCLAAAAQSAIKLASLSDPFLRELAIGTGNTTLLGVRSGNEVIVVAKAEGDGAFQISDSVGGGRPNHCTAMGKVMLADMPQEKLDKYLGKYKLRAFTPNTITEKSRLIRELGEVRRTNLAFDDAEFHPELRCVAAPVRDFTGKVAGALAMSGPAWRLSLQALQERSSLLRNAAERLSAQLGYSARTMSPRASKSTTVKKTAQSNKGLSQTA